MTAAITLAAPAKINLTLHVTTKRADGYHDIESLIGFTSIADRLTLRDAEALTLRVTGPEAAGVETDERNLVLRAAKLMQSHLNTSRGMDINLEKNIPVAAGLGGGSADAAAMVAGCMSLWGNTEAAPISDQTLATDLGADVPVCRHGRAAWISGIGDHIAPANPWPPAWLVLVNPRVAVATARVFNAFDGPMPPRDKTDFAGGEFTDLAAFLATRGNSLTAPAIKLAPVIKDVLTALDAFPQCHLARMSGSGPTCFGLFDNEEAAQHSKEMIQRNHRTWWIKTSPLLDVAPA